MYPYHLKQLLNGLQLQAEQLRRIEQMVKDLRTEMDTLRQSKSSAADRIEYHFDLLKIERLEGTLNIGVMPTGGKPEGDIEVNGQSLVPPQGGNGGSAAYTDIYEDVTQYLYNDIAGELDRSLKKLPVDSAGTSLSIILEDIRKQVGERIKVYMDQYGRSGEEPDAVLMKQTIAQQVKKEIAYAINQHLQQVQGKWKRNEADSHQ